MASLNFFIYKSLTWLFIFLCGLCGGGASLAAVEVSRNEGLLNPALFIKHAKYSGGATLETICFDSTHEIEPGKITKIKREGMLLKRPGACGTLFICHGFMCSKFDCSFMRMMLPLFNIVTFDFRAHGERVDSQQCCTFGRDEASDVIAAVNYIKSRSDMEGLRFCFGFSMGAVASIMAQAAEPNLFDAMVLDCPYDHSINVIKKGLENLKFPFFGYEVPIPRDFLEQYAFQPWLQTWLKGLLKTVANMDCKGINTYIHPVSPVEAAAKIEVPCLLIHCKNDEKVPVSAARAIFNNLKGVKRLYLTAGRNHFDSLFFYPEKYFYCINHFLEDVATLKIQHKKREKIIEDVV